MMAIPVCSLTSPLVHGFQERITCGTTRDSGSAGILPRQNAGPGLAEADRYKGRSRHEAAHSENIAQVSCRREGSGLPKNCHAGEELLWSHELEARAPGDLFGTEEGLLLPIEGLKTAAADSFEVLQCVRD